MITCNLGGSNLPLLIDHVRREAIRFRVILLRLQNGIKVPLAEQALQEEIFWLRIMGEHAHFIAHLLDPSERPLVSQSLQFAGNFETLRLQAKDLESMEAVSYTHLDVYKRQEVNYMANILQIKHLGKKFGANEVLRDINFSVSKGEVVCIIGASGSGKSTLLRCINLLEYPTSGDILYHGQNILEQNISNAVYRAKMGMVFQQFNLFNNLTVLDNCVVGQIKVLKRNKEEARKTAMEYLSLIHI